MKLFFVCCGIMMTSLVHAQPVLQLEVFSADVAGDPLGLVNCGDERLFSVGQSGYIMIIGTDGVVQETPFLDIDDRVESDYNAHGLLGLVFHPDYIDNGFFYVNYINNDGNTVISRFSVSAGDPDLADPDSEEILLSVEQPYIVHKGGDLQFGPDGMLYVPLGDGGTLAPDYLGDPDNRSQNPLSYLGKMLRLDVDGGFPYAIPTDNPYAAAIDTLPEIWAMGLRNPWRFSFDKLTGDMWLSDVGQDEWEEVNFESAGYTGGNNYGWRCYEGDVIYNPDSCDGLTDFTFPIHAYPHIDSIGGYSITGGYVYRGSAHPGLSGKYLFCDYVTGNFFSLEADGPGSWVSAVYPDILSEVVSFGEDASGELYVVVRATSTIYTISDACSDLTVESVTTAADCFLGAVGSINLSVDGGTAPYTYSWSTGDMTAGISDLESGVYDVTITDALGCIIDSTFEVVQEGAFILDYTVSGDTIIASEITDGTYTWYLDGVLLPDAMGNVLLPEIPGTYTLIVTSAFGCADTIELLFDPMSFEIVSEPTFTIYPNPVDAMLYGRFGHEAIGAQLQIRSPDGQQILVMEVVKENLALDIQSWPAGMYILNLTKGNTSSSTSFVVQ